MKKKQLQLRVIALFAALSLISLSLCIVLVREQYDDQYQQSLASLDNLRDRNINALEWHIDQMGYSLFKVKLDLIASGLLHPDRDIDRTALEGYLAKSEIRRALVSQIRWLDEQGVERVRLNSAERGSEDFVSAKQLQDKSQRYYFTDVIDAQNNAIYVSPIDLNIEHGTVVKPFQPTVRLALPTRHSEGLRKGVIVINFDLTELFNAIYRGAGPGLVFHLLDSRGNLLIDTEDPERAWESMLGLSAAAERRKRAQMLAESEDSAPPLGMEDGPFIALEGLISRSERRYFTEARLSEDYRSGLLVGAILHYWFLYFLLFVISVLLCAYIYYYERRLRALNEELADQVQQVKQADEYKTAFLANMSHEIRTPLTSIIGLLDIVKSSHDQGLIRRNLDMVSSAADSLLALINDILDLRKVESGRLELEAGAVNLEAIADQTVALFAPEAEAKGLAFVFAVDPSLHDLSLEGDALRISQIMNNLVGNAVKFTQSGAITINMKLLGKDSDRVTLRVAVSDTGIGLDPAQLDELCQAFVQSDVSITRKYGGTGLGLTITRHLLELMGSKLEVDSQKGVGSTFSFQLQLPLIAEQLDELTRLRREVPSHVLIAERDTAVSNVLVEMFSYWHCRCTQSLELEQALADFERALNGTTPCGLLVVDLELPGGGGYAFLEGVAEIVKSVNLPSPPAIRMLTSRDAIELPRYDRVGVLQKPVTMSRLLEAMARQGVISIIGDQPPQLDIAEQLKTQLAQRLSVEPAPRILIADDNAHNRVLLEELFVSFGLTPVLVEDGREAVNAVERQAFDMVFMDIQMPIMDGLTAAREIRAKISSEQLPIVAVSAATFDSDIDEALAAGMDAHLAKPINVEKLLMLILQFWRPVQRKSRLSNPVASRATDSGLAEDKLHALFEEDGFNADLTVYKLIGAAGYRRVAKAFVEDMTDALAQQEKGAALNEQDARRFLHRLISASGAVGAVALHDHARQLQARIKAGESVSLAPLYDQIRACISTLQRYL